MNEDIKIEEVKTEEVKTEEVKTEEVKTEEAEEKEVNTEEIRTEDTGNSLGIRISESFKSRKFRGGAYALILSVIVIAVFIVVNLMATDLNVSWDLTSDEKYSLTDETVDFIKDIKEKITVYYMCEEGAELDLFDKIMKKFETEGSNIKVTIKDPVKYPKFSEQYTEEDITQNSVIVVNNDNGRAKYIPYADMLISEFNYETYQTDTIGIDVEGQIVSAIRYVISDDLPLMYSVSGHGEATISSTMATAIAKENVDTADLNLVTEEKVPEDCDILLVYYPRYDYSAEEVQKLKDYLNADGKIIFLADIGTSELPNLTDFLKYYGMELVPGYVVEGDSGYAINNTPYIIVPSVESHEITTDIRSNRLVIMPVCAGIQVVDDARSTITFNPILTTSNDAYSKVDKETTTNSKEEGDIDGPFNLGIEMTETYNGHTSQMVVYTSGYFIADEYLTYNTYGNADMFFNTINYLADVEVNVSVRTTSLSEETIVLTSSQANTLGIIYMVIIPLAVIGLGIFVVVRRKKMG